MGGRGVSEYDFNERLTFSRGIREGTDISTLQNMIPGSISCRKTTEQEDRSGVDYVLTLRRGAIINVDAKSRDAGCSKWWLKRSEPELALELWSIRPHQGSAGKCGWTSSESSNVDLILFTFDRADTHSCFLVPFQLLRVAFRKFGADWIKNPDFKSDIQKSRRGNSNWESECVFVPHWVVEAAIQTVSEGVLVGASLTCDVCGGARDRDGPICWQCGVDRSRQQQRVTP